MFGSGSRAQRWLAIFLVSAFCACDGEDPIIPPTPDEPPTRVSLTWQHPTPQGNDLNRMWGFPDGTFDAVGDGGSMLHFDGTGWSHIDTPAREDLHGIWASAPDNIYAAGFKGSLVHYNGSSWQSISTPTQQDLYSVWGDGTGGIFITGTGGYVWERRRGAWTEHIVAPGRRFRSLWGYSANDVYVLGSTGAVYHYDGSKWTRVVNPLDPSSNMSIRDAWGPGPGSLAFVGGTGVYYFAGSAWRFLPLSSESGYGIWGFSLDEQMMVTAGNSFEWRASRLTRFVTALDDPLYDVWGTSTTNYFAVGKYGRVAHFDGTSWQYLDSGSRSNLADIWVSEGAAVAVGDSGIVMRNDGAGWAEETVDVRYELAGVWDSGTGFAVAVGRFAPDLINWRQAILTNSGSDWVDAGVVGTAHRLFDVWGSSASDVYAVGWAGEILHYDGSWSVVDDGDGDAAFLSSVSGSSAHNVIAVGRTDGLHGLVCRYNGTTWTKTELAGLEELSAVWVQNETNAIAVGSSGAIRRFDGTTWTKMSSPTREPLFCVWGSSASDVYAAGWEGTLIHYDGSQWKKLLPNTHRSLNGIAGRSAGEIYFVGDRGSILRFDGF